MKVGHEKHRILYIHTRKFEGEVKGMGDSGRRRESETKSGQGQRMMKWFSKMVPVRFMERDSKYTIAWGENRNEKLAKY